MNSLPKHIAVIMDGNGRWAKQRRLPRIAGHRAGAKSVRKAIEFCVRKKIDVLSLFALSIENYQSRPEKEVQFLVSLLLESLQKNTEELNKNNVRIRIIGDYSYLSDKLCQQIRISEKLTQNNDGLTLVIAINYSGRWDVTHAMQALAKRVAAGELSANEIDEMTVGHALCLADLPDPDLLIRTSGEQRISNFMLWQTAYSELFFTDIFWPDFNEHTFEQALRFYQTRERRFGLTSEQLESQNA